MPPLIVEASAPKDMETVRTLFREYAAWLKVDLCFQGFQEELATLPGLYIRPQGRLYLAKVDDETAGCIAMKPLADDVCEMKRLYVRPNYRGQGIARSLVQTLFDEAKMIGYSTMRLDTMQRMEAAIQLYKSFGFVETGRYCFNPEEDAVFMERSL
jgi:ribosomal protein S18 acetylase RimI-like enzyme